LNFIGQIHPPSKEHQFMLVAIEYFTKWTEVVPLNNVTHNYVIMFIIEYIIHRFGIPQTSTNIDVLHLCLFKLESLLSHIRSNCSIHPHSMLRRTVRPNLVIKL
jgi:hypothetical protein